MVGEKIECIEVRAEKFQRLILGSLLFFSYIFQYIPIVPLVISIMILSCLFSAKYTPFYQLFIRILKKPGSSETGCDIACGANRFACFLGAFFLAVGLLLFYLGKQDVAWILVLVVGTLSVLAGTIGFCLGAALYAILFKEKMDNPDETEIA